MIVDLYDDQIGQVALIEHKGTDKTVVNAARVSFGKENKKPLNEKDKKLIKYLLENHHTSPFEHCVVTFKFTVPLFVRSQIMRHRTFSYSEISRRYTSENIQFFIPKTFRGQSLKNLQGSANEIEPKMGSYSNLSASELIQDHCIASYNLFEALLNAGVCREQARMVLPTNLYTQFYGTVNLHNLFHFLDLRLNKRAQKETREAAEGCLKIVRELYPVCVEVYLRSKMPAVTM